MHPQGIGQSVLRREDNRLLTGRGQFVADVLPENTYYCAFLRSPHAHALIKGIDVSGAQKSQGVIAVFTGQDLLKDGVGKMTPLWMIPGANGSQMNEPPRYSITVDRVRHVGEIVAMVVAKTVHQAIDASLQ